MQLSIRILLEEPCNLPLAYHHVIQSALYSLMKEPGEEHSVYHEGGARYGARVFRLFTFGLLRGTYRIEKDRIIFTDEIRLEMRSTDEHCIRLVETNLKENGIWIEGRAFQNVVAQMRDDTVEKTELLIRMDSPICVYATDRETKKTTFFAPEDARFAKAVDSNFRRKYEAAFQKPPESGIVLTAVHVSRKDKYVTKYKGFYISGWRGEYSLSGERKYLDFLYQTGLGAKNAQGFGMFHVVG